MVWGGGHRWVGARWSWVGEWGGGKEGVMDFSGSVNARHSNTHIVPQGHGGGFLQHMVLIKRRCRTSTKFSWAATVREEWRPSAITTLTSRQFPPVASCRHGHAISTIALPVPRTPTPVWNDAIRMSHKSILSAATTNTLELSALQFLRKLSAVVAILPYQLPLP